MTDLAAREHGFAEIETQSDLCLSVLSVADFIPS